MCILLNLSASSRFVDVVQIHQVPGETRISEDALALVRIVGDVVFQALPNHEATQNCLAGILELVWQSACAVANEVTDADDNGFVAYRSGGFTLKNVDTLVLVVMHVVFC